MPDLTFKRLSYSNTQSLSITESTLSTDLKDDEILVKIRSVSINPVDLILYNTSIFINFFKWFPQFGIGRDFSGIIHSTGSKITEYKPGDKVSGIYKPIYGTQGSFGEYLKFRIDEVSMGKIPEMLTFEQAASFPTVFGTAVSILRKFHVPGPESRVLILGGGTSVGHYVIQLLKEYHDAKSIVSVNSNLSTSLVKEMGADIVIDYTKEDIPDRVLEVVGQDDKFDLIVDCVGNNELFGIINHILKPQEQGSGYVTIVGDTIADYKKSMLAYFSLSTLWKFIPWLRSFNYGFVTTCDDYYPLAKELFESKKLRTVIDDLFPLNEYQKAFDKMATHKAKGKIIITIEQEQD